MSAPFNFIGSISFEFCGEKSYGYECRVKDGRRAKVVVVTLAPLV